ncbi:MAG: transaldolase [Helicobacteraceae bacterium]|jgi:transaldolase|nr:transaldolase [Helicobacteraceae bacterium]
MKELNAVHFSKIRNFSLWIDYLDREFLAEKLNVYLDKLGKGITTNPAIFQAALANSKLYAKEIESMSKKNIRPKKIYETLAIADVQKAADQLSEIFNKQDGFVSIEVDPNLARDRKATLDEAKRLHKAIGKENVMIKIPATTECVPAIKELLDLGIPTNATLVFHPDQTREILRAVRSSETPLVISVFVSRFDRAVDGAMPDHLRMKTGIMNAAWHYNLIREANRPNTRALFASTGVKKGEQSAKISGKGISARGKRIDPDYYIRELISEDSVNTAPLAAIDHFLLNPNTTAKLPIPQKTIDVFIERFKFYKVDFNAVAEQLMKEGLEQFQAAFADILNQIKSQKP